MQVDCFSYGMLVYEIVTCRQPFEGHEAVKEAILEGARPALTARVSLPSSHKCFDRKFHYYVF